MRHVRSIEVSKVMSRRLKELCEKAPGRARVDPDERAWVRMATFADSIVVDINVVATNDPDEFPCWCEAILYKMTGRDIVELARTEPADGSPFGEWIFNHDGDEYVVNVVEEEA